MIIYILIITFISQRFQIVCLLIEGIKQYTQYTGLAKKIAPLDKVP